MTVVLTSGSSDQIFPIHVRLTGWNKGQQSRVQLADILLRWEVLSHTDHVVTLAGRRDQSLSEIPHSLSIISLMVFFSCIGTTTFHIDFIPTIIANPTQSFVNVSPGIRFHILHKVTLPYMYITYYILIFITNTSLNINQSEPLPIVWTVVTFSSSGKVCVYFGNILLLFIIIIVKLLLCYTELSSLATATRQFNKVGHRYTTNLEILKMSQCNCIDIKMDKLWNGWFEYSHSCNCVYVYCLKISVRSRVKMNVLSDTYLMLGNMDMAKKISKIIWRNMIKLHFIGCFVLNKIKSYSKLSASCQIISQQEELLHF